MIVYKWGLTWQLSRKHWTYKNCWNPLIFIGYSQLFFVMEMSKFQQPLYKCIFFTKLVLSPALVYYSYCLQIVKRITNCSETLILTKNAKTVPMPSIKKVKKLQTVTKPLYLPNCLNTVILTKLFRNSYINQNCPEILNLTKLSQNLCIK